MKINEIITKENPTFNEAIWLIEEYIFRLRGVRINAVMNTGEESLMFHFFQVAKKYFTDNPVIE